MKHRILATLLSLAMLTGLLAGCGSTPSSTASSGGSDAASGESGEKLSFTFWTLWDGTDAPFAQAMVEQFEEEYNCDIEMVTMSSSDFYTKLSTAGVTGQGPDVATLHATAYVNDFKEAGIITSLNQACEQYGVDINFSDYSNTVSDNVIIDDEYYALPLDTIGRVIAYNTQLLEGTSALDENGKLVETTTYEEFCDLMDTIKSELGDSIAAPIAFSPQNGQHVLNWLSFYEQDSDVPFFTDDQVTFDDASAVKVLKDFASFYQTYCLEGLTGTEDVQMFIDGQVPIIVTGTFNIGTILEGTGDYVGLTYYPQWYAERAVTVNAHSLALCNKEGRSDEQTKLCLEFIKWWGEHGELWAKSGALPANQTVYSNEEFLSLQGRTDLVENLQYSKALPKTPTGQMQAITDINTPIGSAMTGDMSAEDAVAAVRAYCEQAFADAAAG